MTSSLDDFLTAATRAARPGQHHPGAALEARAYLAVTIRIIRAVLAVCDAADGQYGHDAGVLTTQEIRAAIDDARRNR